MIKIKITEIYKNKDYLAKVSNCIYEETGKFPNQMTIYNWSKKRSFPQTRLRKALVNIGIDFELN